MSSISSSTMCPVVCGVDKEISKLCENQNMYNPQLIARLKELYLGDKDIKDLLKEKFREYEKNKAYKEMANILRNYKKQLFNKEIQNRKNFSSSKEISDRLAKNYSNEFAIPSMDLEPSNSPMSARKAIIVRAKNIAKRTMDVVNDLQREHPHLSRIDILKGKTIPFKGTIGGIIYLFDEAKRRFEEEYLEAVRTANKYLQNMDEDMWDNETYYYGGLAGSAVTFEAKDIKSDKIEGNAAKDVEAFIEKIIEEDDNPFTPSNIKDPELRHYIIKVIDMRRMLNNWYDLTWYAMRDIADRTGAKIKIDGLKKIDPLDNFSGSLDSDYVEEDMEERTKESYQFDKEKRSPESKMTPVVRDFTSTIPLRIVESSPDTEVESSPRLDDMGGEIYMDQKKAQKEMQGLFGSMLSVSEIYEFINGDQPISEAANSIWYALRNALHTMKNGKALLLINQLFIHFSAYYAPAWATDKNTSRLLDLNSKYNVKAKVFFSNLMNNVKRAILFNFVGKSSTKNYELKADKVKLFLTIYNDLVAQGYMLDNSSNNKYRRIGSRPIMLLFNSSDMLDKVKASLTLANLLNYLNIDVLWDSIFDINSTLEGKRAIFQILNDLDDFTSAFISYLNSSATEKEPKVDFAYNTGGRLLDGGTVNGQRITIKEKAHPYIKNEDAIEKLLLNNDGTKKSFFGLMSYVSTGKDVIALKKLIRILNTLENFDSERSDDSFLYIDRYGKKARYYNVSEISSLYDFIRKIEYFTVHKDVIGFNDWLTNKYLRNPLICRREADGKYTFFNNIIAELYSTLYTNTGVLNIDRFTSLCDDTNSILNQMNAGRVMGLNNKKFADASPSEHVQMMLSNVFYGERGLKNSDNFALIPVFTLGDANCYKSLTGIRYKFPGIKNISFEQALDQYLNKAADRLYNTYLGELARFELIAKFKANGWEIPNFLDERRGSLFVDLPFLNGDFGEAYKLVLNDNGNITDFTNGVRQLLSLKKLSDTEVKDKIKKYLKYSYENTIKDWVEKGLIEELKKGESVEYKYSYKTKNMFEEYFGKNVEADLAIKEAAAEFLVTTKQNIIDQFNMFSGTPAFYKDVKLMLKRNKQLHSSGQILNLQAKDNGVDILDPNDLSEKCIYIKDPKNVMLKVNPDEYNSILYTKMQIYQAKGYNKNDALNLAKKEMEPYNKGTITDGQAWRTLKSYRRLMIMSGKWDMHPEFEAAYKEITKLLSELRKPDLSDKAKEQIKAHARALMVSFKPEKPFNNGFERLKNSDGTTVDIPYQHKYAEIVIIPELLNEGSKLRALAEWADVDVQGSDGVLRPQCDLILSEECIKVGLCEVVDITEKSGVTNAETLNERLKTAYIHKIPYSGYRLMTSSLDHANEETLFGTLSRKLWYSGIDKSKTYQRYVKSSEIPTIKLLNGNETRDIDAAKGLTGKDLIEFYNQLITANIIDSYDEFAKVFKGTDKELSKLLTEGVFLNTNQTIDAFENFLLSGDEKFLLPVFSPNLDQDTQSYIISIFKKAVNKQKIAGGTMIQASPMGQYDFQDSSDLKFIMDPRSKIKNEDPNFKDKDGNTAEFIYTNVLYCEMVLPFDIKVLTPNGKVIQLDFSTYCNEDGTLKVGHVITDENSEEYQSGLYQSYITEDGHQYVPLLEEHYPGSLDTIMKRIPTERYYSMYRGRTKRFTPISLGNVVMLPAEGPSMGGFDFDIDKGFFMRKEFRMLDFTEDQLDKLWTEFYNSYPLIKNVLERSNAHRVKKDGLITEFGKLLAKAFSGTSLDNQAEVDEIQNRLYKNWDNALLGGTYLDAFFNFLYSKISKGNKKILSILLFDKYDGTKTAIENSTVARNNMLFELFLARMSDLETMESRFYAQGFPNASIAARAMRELIFGDKEKNKDLSSNGADFTLIVLSDDWKDPEPNYDYSDYRTLVYFNEQNQIADKLIGVFANHNNAHAYLEIFDKVKLKQAIAFGSYNNSAKDDFLHKNNRSLRIDSERYIAELLAASVDAVKDPVLNYLNINSYTANVAAMLARLGYSLYDIGLLLTQPIIKEYCKLALDKGTDIAQNEIMKRVLDDNFDGNTIFAGGVSETSTIALQNAIIDGNSMTSLQNYVFKMFTLINALASALSDLTTITKMSASNSVGSTIAFFANQAFNADYIQSQLYDDNGYLDVSPAEIDGKVQITIDSKLDMESADIFQKLSNNPLAMEQAFYSSNRGVIKLLANIFPYTNKYTSYPKFIELLKLYSFYDQLSESIIKYAYTDILTYLLSHEPESVFNPEVKVKGLFKEADGKEKEYTAADYFNILFGSDFLNFKNSFSDEDWKKLVKLYPILDYITVSISTFERDSDIFPTLSLRDKKKITHSSVYIQHPRDMFKSDKTILKQSWADLSNANKNKGLLLLGEYIDKEGIIVEPGKPVSSQDIFIYLQKDYVLGIIDDYNAEIENGHDVEENKEDLAELKRRVEFSEKVLKELDEKLKKDDELRDTLSRLSSYLVYHSFHTSGNTYSPISLVHDAPAEVMRNLDTIERHTGANSNEIHEKYTEFLKGIMPSKDGNNIIYPTKTIDNFTEMFLMFIRNHSDIKNFTRYIGKNMGESYERINKLVKNGNDYLDSFSISYDNAKELSLDPFFFKIIKNVGNTSIKFMPAIKILNLEEDVLYIAEPINDKYSVDLESTPITYKKVSILGESDKYSRYYEYDINPNKIDVHNQNVEREDGNDSDNMNESPEEMFRNYISSDEFKVKVNDIKSDPLLKESPNTDIISEVAKEAAKYIANLKAFDSVANEQATKDGKIFTVKEGIFNEATELLKALMENLKDRTSSDDFVKDVFDSLKLYTDNKSNIITLMKEEIAKSSEPKTTNDENGNIRNLCN